VTNCRTNAATAVTTAGAASGTTCSYYTNLAGVSTNILAAMDGLTLTAGKYCGAAMSLAATSATSNTLKLDGQNNSNSQWIFRGSASVDVGVGSTIKLINGGVASNVYWILDTSLNTGVDSTFIGIAITTTSINLGVRTYYYGRAIATTTVVVAEDCTIIIPYVSPTSNPTSQPSTQPTSIPTRPSGQPTRQPTGQPSMQPSSQPM
jgi:Kef-type K+ transport system membrane component KefB